MTRWPPPRPRAARGGRRGARAGDSLCRDPAAGGGAGGGAARARRAGGPLPRRRCAPPPTTSKRRSWATRWTWWWRRPRSGWASTSPTSAGCSTPSRPTRWTRTSRRSGAPAATAPRRGRGCSTARRTSACGASSPGTGQVGPDELEQVVDAVKEAGAPVEPGDLLAETELSQSKLTTAVSRLEDAGAVELLPGGEIALVTDAPPREQAVAARSRRRSTGARSTARGWT